MIRQKQSSLEQTASTPTGQPADIFTNDDTAVNMGTRESLFPEGSIANILTVSLKYCVKPTKMTFLKSVNDTLITI